MTYLKYIYNRYFVWVYEVKLNSMLNVDCWIASIVNWRDTFVYFDQMSFTLFDTN